MHAPVQTGSGVIEDALDVVRRGGAVRLVVKTKPALDLVRVQAGVRRHDDAERSFRHQLLVAATAVEIDEETRPATEVEWAAQAHREEARDRRRARIPGDVLLQPAARQSERAVTRRDPIRRVLAADQAIRGAVFHALRSVAESQRGRRSPAHRAIVYA